MSGQSNVVKTVHNNGITNRQLVLPSRRPPPPPRQREERRLATEGSSVCKGGGFGGREGGVKGDVSVRTWRDRERTMVRGRSLQEPARS